MNLKEFKVKKRGDKWLVVGHNGDVKGEHSSKREAEDQIKAIYANGYQEAADRMVATIRFAFPQSLVGYSDIHSQGQLAGSPLNIFGRGVATDAGDVRLGGAGASHIGLARGLLDAKRFYFGYSKELQTVYIVPKNSIDSDFFRKESILKRILSNIFDTYRLSIAPGRRLTLEAKEITAAFIDAKHLLKNNVDIYKVEALLAEKYKSLDTDDIDDILLEVKTALKEMYYSDLLQTVE